MTRAAAGRDRDAGFTLVEVLVAFTVLTLVSTAVVSLLTTSQEAVRSSRERAVAASLAARVVEEARRTAASDRSGTAALPLGLTTDALPEAERTVNGIPFDVRRTVSWVTSETASSVCADTDSGDRPYLRVGVEVTWPGMTGQPPVRSDTLVTPRLGSYDPATSAVAVTVLDRSGRGAPGHVVTLTGPGGAVRTQTTDADGCVFAPFLGPGSWTASVATVDHVEHQTGSPTWSRAVTLVAGGVPQQLSLSYDRAATLVMSAASPGYPLGSPGVTAANSSVAPDGRFVLLGSGSSRTTAVFPHLAGVALWAGACPSSDPQTLLTASGTVAARPDPVPLASGGTTTAAVVGRPVAARVTRPDGTPVPDVVVRATHDSGGCSDSVAAGLTDATGTARVTAPFGPGWTWSVDGHVLADPAAGGPHDHGADSTTVLDLALGVTA